MKILILPLFFAFSINSPVDAATKQTTAQKHDKPWKTLENAYGKWTVSYPSDWELDDSAGANAREDREGVILGPQSAEKKDEQIGAISIEKIETYPQNIDSKEYVRKWYKGRGSENIDFSNEKQTDIAGVKGDDFISKYKTKNNKDVEIRWIIFKREGQLYSAVYAEHTTLVSAPKRDWKYENIFERVISTLKFKK